MSRWDPDARRWVDDARPAAADPPPAPYGPPPGEGGAPPGASHPGGDRRRPATAITAVLAFVAAVTAGVMVYMLVTDDGRNAAGPAPGVSAPVHRAPPQAPASGEPDPETSTAAPSPSVRAAPPGYRFQSGDGFRLVAPDGWKPESRRTAKGPVYSFPSADEPGWTLQVWPVSEDVSEPADVVDLAENGPGALNALRDYHRHGPVTEGSGYAELDYSYTGGGHGRMRALYRALRTPDGRLWAIVVSGAADAWPRQREIQQTVLAYFCLTGHCDYRPGS